MAVCTQVYEYVEDIVAALAEARGCCAPAAGCSCWTPTGTPSSGIRATASGWSGCSPAWNEHLADPYLPRRLPGLLRAAGLEPTRSAIIPVLNVGADHDTLSAGISGLVAAYVAGRGGVSEAEATAWEQDLAGLGDDYFFSLNRYLFVAERS